MIPIVGVSLEEALLGFGGDDAELHDKEITHNGIYLPSDDGWDGYSRVTVNVSGGLTLDYIISNGHALYAEPIQIAEDTVLESTLAAYSVNLFMVRDGAQLAQVQNIGSQTAGYKDTFARQTNYWYRTYAVYYVNGVPTWGQEVYISSTNAHRDVFNEEYYTWTGGASEGDFFYAVLPSSNQVIDLTYVTSGVYEMAFNISNMSNGFIMLIPRKTGGSYLDIPVNYTYYYYTTYNDRAPELNRETHSTSTQTPSVNIKFPYVDTNYRESYDIVTNGMSRDAVNDLIMSISAEIYQFYLSL